MVRIKAAFLWQRAAQMQCMSHAVHATCYLGLHMDITVTSTSANSQQQQLYNKDSHRLQRVHFPEQLSQHAT
jgi:hypothetical protein